MTFTDETTSGWQAAYFDSPLTIQAGRTYIASYTTPTGYYGFEANYFTSSGHTSGPLTAPQSTPEARNGIFSETPGQFPASSYNNSNYFVDVTFQSGPDTTVPMVATRTPADGATGVATSATVSATFSEAVSAASVTETTFTLEDGDTTVPAAVSTSGSTVTLTPTSPLAADRTFTATLVGGAGGITDLAGNPLANDVTWTFRTLPSETTAYTIFGDSQEDRLRALTGDSPSSSASSSACPRAATPPRSGSTSPTPRATPSRDASTRATAPLLGEGTTVLPRQRDRMAGDPLPPTVTSPPARRTSRRTSPPPALRLHRGGLVGAELTDMVR